MNIGFFTRGDNVIGMGHIYRCLALAHLATKEFRWQAGFEAGPGEEGRSILNASGFPVAEIDGPGPSGKDWDVLVADQLDIPLQDMVVLRDRCNKLVAIDNTGPGIFAADLAFNSLYRCARTPPPGTRTDRQFGLDYLIIDQSFLSQSYVVRDPVKSVFLTQGGSDTFNILNELLETLIPWSAEKDEIEIHAHIGPAYKFHDQFDRIVSNSRSNVTVHRDVADLASVMESMDLAISAVGMTACELASIGVPTVLVTGEEKELETAEEFARRGMAINLGRYGPKTSEELRETLDTVSSDFALRQKLSECARQNIDGKGALRILGKIKEVVCARRKI